MLLTVSAPGCGAHPEAWRFSSAPKAPSLGWFQSLTRTAERGGLDAILFDGAWGPAGPFMLDPVPLIAALASASKHIGLAAAIALDHSEPFNIARSYAAIDRLTAGRSAWIATMGTGCPSDFGHAPKRDAATSRARAVECIAVVRKLWDSWEDEAIVLDKPNGKFSNPDYIHPINHAGEHFTVRGPLNAPRPLQGNPPVIQRDAGPEGLALARETADVLIASVADASALAGIRRGLGDRAKLLVKLSVLLAPSDVDATARAKELGGALDGLSFIGTPDGLAARLAELSALCDGVDLWPAVLPTDLDLLVNQVVPTLLPKGLRPASYQRRTLREHLGLPRPRSQFAA
ncbi:MAG: LLM class flavin-dependent oxidoreductase [Alphaproteobacteria bacterium]|nr:LLM class flavin-dependent oxidoreductase [Alphaproteobacteria bacterium]